MENSCSPNQTKRDLDEEMAEERTAIFDNVDWITVRQLVFNRLSHVFGSQRIQKVMESTRKPNSNDWFKAAATKISSEWQELDETHSTEVFPLVALSEDVLNRIFNIYSSTQDMMSLGLVSQQFRRCVNWNKHYLTLDCSSRDPEDFTLNGSLIPVKKWPKLVKILLDKTIITSLTVKIRELPLLTSTITGFLNETMKKCKEQPERLQFETITIHGWVKGGGVESFFHWCMEHCDIVFTHLRSIDVMGIDLFGRRWDSKEFVSNAFKGKPIESIELNNMKSIYMRPPKNVDISKVCNNLPPQTLRILKTDSPEHSLLQFIHDTPRDVISGLKTLSYTGYKTEFERTDEMIDLLWQQSPYLEYCTFGVISAVLPTSDQIAQLIHNIFQSLKYHSKTNGPVTIELCRISEPRRHDTNFYLYYDLVLRLCQTEQILALLQDYDPETHIFDCREIEEIDKLYYGTCTIKRGHFSLIIEQVSCCPNRRSFTDCTKCSSDPRMLLKNVYKKLDFARRNKRYTKKMNAWCLPLCQSDQLKDGLRKKLAKVKFEQKTVENQRFQKISLGGDYVMIECVSCHNEECNICHP